MGSHFLSLICAKFIVFFYNFLFLYLDPPVSVLEDRNVMQHHRMCKRHHLLTFLTSKVQRRVIFVEL